jgi:hypothetical protein
MDLERNEEESRRIILERLSRRGKKWTTAKAILGQASTQGPWSEDLEQLIREGRVECQDSSPGPRSFIREASSG